MAMPQVVADARASASRTIDSLIGQQILSLIESLSSFGDASGCASGESLGDRIGGAPHCPRERGVSRELAFEVESR